MCDWWVTNIDVVRQIVIISCVCSHHYDGRHHTHLTRQVGQEMRLWPGVSPWSTIILAGVRQTWRQHHLLSQPAASHEPGAGEESRRIMMNQDIVVERVFICYSLDKLTPLLRILLDEEGVVLVLITSKYSFGLLLFQLNWFYILNLQHILDPVSNTRDDLNIDADHYIVTWASSGETQPPGPRPQPS